MAQEVEVKFTVSGVDGSIKDLNDLVKALNKTEDATEDLQEKQKESAEESGFLQDRFNGLKDTAKKLRADFKNVINVFKSTGKGASSLGKVMKGALIASGIGLVIVAVTSLISWFKNFEGAARAVQKVVNGLGAVFSSLGSMFSSLIKGDFKGAKDAFTGIGDAVSEAVQATDALFDAQQKLANIQKTNLIQNAQTRQEIEKYKKILEDTTLSEGKRLAALDEVTKRTKQLAQAQLDENQAQIDALEASIALENNFEARRDLEVELAGLRAERIEQQTELNNIEYDAVRVGREIRQAAEEERKAKAEEAKKEREAEAQAQADAEAKAAEQKIANEQYIADELQRIRTEGIADEFERARAELDIQEQANIEKLRLAGATEEQITEVQASYAKKREDLAKEESDYNIDLAKAEEDAKLELAANALGAISQLVGESSAVGKAAAVAATVINTYRGAQAAFAETPGGIAIKSIAAGVAVASGLANVRKIIQTETPGNASAGGSTPNISAPRPRQFNATPGVNGLLSGFAGNNTVTPDMVTKTYVVAEDVTSQQEANKKINDLARL